MVTVMLRTVQQTMENVWSLIVAITALNFDLKYLKSRYLIICSQPIKPSERDLGFPLSVGVETEQRF